MFSLMTNKFNEGLGGWSAFDIFVPALPQLRRPHPSRFSKEPALSAESKEPALS